jgi:hypothetical protein
VFSNNNLKFPLRLQKNDVAPLAVSGFATQNSKNIKKSSFRAKKLDPNSNMTGNMIRSNLAAIFQNFKISRNVAHQRQLSWLMEAVIKGTVQRKLTGVLSGIN